MLINGTAKKSDSQCTFKLTGTTHVSDLNLSSLFAIVDCHINQTKPRFAKVDSHVQWVAVRTLQVAARSP